MKPFIPLFAVCAGFASGPALRPAAAQAPNPPPPVYVAPTPAAPKPAEAAPVWTPPPGPAAPPTAPARLSAADLEKLAAPIAIYPDPIIASILTAAVYPIEVVQAARFVANTNNIPQIDAQPWDTNVKTVAKIPGLIQKMDKDLTWTIQLGQAFVEQPMELMNAMQDLRAKAQAAGKLKTTPQQVVTTTNAVVERVYEGQTIYVTNTVIQIQPASKEVVYVPSYNPSTIYIDDDDDDFVGFMSFGVGIAFGAAFWGDCDWHYGGCYWGGYPPPPPPYPPAYHPPPGAPPAKPGGRPPNAAPPGARPPGSRPPTGVRPPTATTLPAQRWQPDQTRLSASGTPSVATRDARGWGGAAAQPVQRPASGGSVARPSQLPSSGAGGPRPSTQPSVSGSRPGGSARPAPTPSVSRPSTQPSINRSAPSASVGARPSSSPSVSRPSSASRSSAFSGMSSGGGARSSSSRGAASRGGGGGSRGGGGRGR